MFYLIYKITNQIDGKIYIGAHKTRNLEDNYMGSGKYLKRAQAKYGIKNFTKEILFIFDSPDEMYSKEAELVTEDFIATTNTYNIKIGGKGGWDHINNSLEMASARSERNKKISMIHPEMLRNDPEYRAKFSKKCSEANRNKPRATGDILVKKQKIALDASNAAKASNLGSRWITDGFSNNKIKKDVEIPEGWKLGRTGNFINKRYK